MSDCLRRVSFSSARPDPDYPGHKLGGTGSVRAGLPVSAGSAATGKPSDSAPEFKKILNFVKKKNFFFQKFLFFLLDAGDESFPNAIGKSVAYFQYGG